MLNNLAKNFIVKIQKRVAEKSNFYEIMFSVADRENCHWKDVSNRK